MVAYISTALLRSRDRYSYMMQRLARAVHPLGWHAGLGARDRCASTVSTASIKELRARSGAPISAVKDALVAENGDIDAAFDYLRKLGAKLASARSARTAEEGLIGVLRNSSGKEAAVVELNCETDFVSRTDIFRQALSSLAASALDISSPYPTTTSSAFGDHVELNLEELSSTAGNDTLLADARTSLGENIRVGRAHVIRGKHVGVYVHSSVADGDSDGVLAGRIGVAVALDSPNELATDVADQLAMHIAAENPLYLRRSIVPEDVLQKERGIFMDVAAREAAAAGSPKPPEILSRMVEGRLNKWLSEVVLEDQAILTADQLEKQGKPPSVRKWLAAHGDNIGIVAFSRLSLGN